MLGTILKETLKGKSIYRTLTNLELDGREFGGNILDIGGGEKKASHYRFLKISEDSIIKTVNIDKDTNPDFLLDTTKDKIPLDNKSHDVIFCFNTLEHLSSWDNILSETVRILKPGGEFFGYIPFLVGVHADPHDYVRMTKEGLQKEFAGAGFEEVKIKPIGRGPFTAAYGQIDFIFFTPLSTLFFFFALGLDWVLRKIRPDLDLGKKYVLTYIFTCRR